MNILRRLFSLTFFDVICKRPLSLFYSTKNWNIKGSRKKTTRDSSSGTHFSAVPCNFFIIQTILIIFKDVILYLCLDVMLNFTLLLKKYYKLIEWILFTIKMYFFKIFFNLFQFLLVCYVCNFFLNMYDIVRFATSLMRNDRFVGCLVICIKAAVEAVLSNKPSFL